MSQLEPIRLDTAQPVPAPVETGAALEATQGSARPNRLQRLLFNFSKAGWALRAEMVELAELGRDVLDGRENINKLKGLAAEPYFQGLDVLEIRGERVLEVIAIRAQQGQRNAWRMSPKDRLGKKQPRTPAGQRQAAWLEKLERAGLVARATTH